MIKRNISPGIVLALFLLIAASIGCKMLGVGSNTNTNDGPKTMKGIPAAKICQLLAHPSFESKFPYNGQSCSGSTYFGARDSRTASYETDNRPSFSYAAIGEQDLVTKVQLSMSKRPDGAEFFAAEGDAVAKLINGQPLPNEIRNAITSPYVGFTATSQVGNAKVELIRSATDSKFDLSFQF